MAHENLITVKQYADRYKVSTTWVYKLIKDGKLKKIEIGKHVFVEL